MKESDRANLNIAMFKKLFEQKCVYQLSPHEILAKANKFQKVETNFLQGNQKKIAILSSATSYFFKQMLKLFLHEREVKPIFYEAEFNSIFEQLLNDNSGLYSFSPEIIIILPDYRDIKEMPKLFSELDEINEIIKKNVEIYSTLWEKIKNKLGHCQIFQSHFVLPLYRTMGTLEDNYIFSPQNVFKALNLELTKARPANVNFIDFDYLASCIGKNQWFDDSLYFETKQSMSFDALKEASYLTSRVISSYFGKIKKCLVLDLDNTLWGGVIGDDGIEGINLNPNHPIGEAYLTFQKYIKALKHRGVILAVCSKNEENIAKNAFSHPQMILKLNDISSFVANWDDKSSNLNTIARELNIGIDSLVFFDDNPAEREIVKKYQPEVEVIKVPEDPAHYVRALDSAKCFEWAQLTTEDINRSKTYIQNKEREKLKEKVVDYDEYLRSLEMSGSAKMLEKINIPRFTQLINKSNQFNLRTQRYTEAYIEKINNDSDHFKLIEITLDDKFGSYGQISSLVLERMENAVFIDTWVMSCRVLNRGVEFLALEAIFRTMKEWSCNEIIGEYIPTAKNILVKNLFDNLGFLRCDSDKLQHLTIKNKTDGQFYLGKNFLNNKHYIKTANYE